MSVNQALAVDEALPFTQLLYMNEQQRLDGQASVLAVAGPMEDGRFDVVLDQTYFYPQGGGQAWDVGEMLVGGKKMVVNEVRFLDGLVHHYGTFEGGEFVVGDTVTLKIQAARRRMNSRLHTAGHLIDDAVKSLGLNWVPTKGIHYEGQAAVEYAGEVENADTWREKIEAQFNTMVGKGFAVKAEMVKKEDLAKYTDFIPENLPANKPIRVVTVWGDKGLPCGGTHVENIRDVGEVVVRYVKGKKGSVKVAYELKN